MGGSKKQKVGYAYYVGFQHLMGQAADAIRGIWVEDRPAWFGRLAGGRGTINAPGLFGGPKSQGGMVGDFDFELGLPAQSVNSYLDGEIDGTVPAYRHRACLVWRGGNVGQNPYMKTPMYRVESIATRFDGTAQWYPAKVYVWPEPEAEAAPVGTDINAAVHGGADDAAGIAAGVTISGLDPKLTYRVTLEVGGFYTAWSQWGAPAITGPSTGSRNTFRAALDGDAARVVQFGDGVIYDGYAAAWAAFRDGWISGASSATFYVVDSPVSDNTGGMSIVLYPDTAGPDINPAHYLRELHTDPVHGLGRPDSEMGASWETAADSYLTEGWGISRRFAKRTPAREMIAEIEKNADAVTYFDRRTGKWEIARITDDYDVATLPTLTSAEIAEVERVERIQPSEAVNTLIVSYYNPFRRAKAAIMLQDLAAIQQNGVIADDLELMGIRWRSLAAKIGLRSLRSRRASIARGTLICTRAADTLTKGAVFILDYPAAGFDAEVCLVTKITYGSSTDHRVTLEFVSHAFAHDNEAIIVTDDLDPGVTGPAEPVAATRRWVAEAPYHELVQQAGHSDTDDTLAADPDEARLMAVLGRPQGGAFDATVQVDPGTGTYAEDGTAEIVPTCTLSADIARDPTLTTIAVTGWTDYDFLALPALAVIGDEFVEVTAATDTTLTVRRGCLDTVPAAHVTGDVVLFWQQNSSLTSSAWVAGDALDVKLLPRTGLGELPLASATADSLTMASRAIRPLGPGKVKAAASYSPAATALQSGPVAFTWEHRNRLTETSATYLAFDDAGNAAEDGTSYRFDVFWVDGSGNRVEPAAASVAIGAGTSASFDPADVPWLDAPSGTIEVDIAVVATRTVGGTDYDCRAIFPHRFDIPDGLSVAEAETWVETGGIAGLTVAEAELWIEES